MYRVVILWMVLAAGYAPLSFSEGEGGEASGGGDDAFTLRGEPAKGKKVYEANCIACHGLDGNGKGPLSSAFDPKPADFTDGARMKTVTDKDLYTIVKSGGPAVGKCMEMGAWKHVLTEEQIHDVVAYIKVFSTKKPLRREYLEREP